MSPQEAEEFIRRRDQVDALKQYDQMTPAPQSVTPAPVVPETIWLQWNGDQEPQDGEPSEVTWSKEKIFPHDVEYIKATTLTTERTAHAATRRELEEHKRRDGILTDAMCEIYATIQGRSAQPIDAIVNGCRAELCEERKK